MEPLMELPAPKARGVYGLRTRLTDWLSSAEARLRVGGGWPVATALREGMELAAEELRVEKECLRDSRHLVDARLARFDALFEHAPVALVVSGADGRICEANAQAERLLDGGRDGLVGKLLVGSVAIEDRRVFRTLLGTLQPEGGVRELPLRLLSRLGSGGDVVATVRACVEPAGARVLYWALREDRHASDMDIL